MNLEWITEAGANVAQHVAQLPPEQHGAAALRFATVFSEEIDKFEELARAVVALDRPHLTASIHRARTALDTFTAPLEQASGEQRLEAAGALLRWALDDAPALVRVLMLTVEPEPETAATRELDDQARAARAVLEDATRDARAALEHTVTQVYASERQRDATQRELEEATRALIQTRAKLEDARIELDKTLERLATAREDLAAAQSQLEPTPEQ
jgi:hypothetical protein